MPIIKLTDDPIVRRLRWVMIGVMVFSMFNTLAGQPGSFWHAPQTAIRGDGLSIHNETNHTFEFFLGYGWQAYLLACLIYFSAAFLVVSTLPRVPALFAIFSVIFGHYFGACNWLAVHWHLAFFSGTSIYGIVLGAIVAFSAFPLPEVAIIKRLRWVAVGAIFLDDINTLIGQPASYWQHPGTVHEGNPLSYFFLSRGYIYFCLYQLVYMAAMFLLISALPKKPALACIFAFTLAGFIGASCWFFYEWRMGMEAPVIFGVILSVAIVWSAFSGNKKISGAFNATLEPACC